MVRKSIGLALLALAAGALIATVLAGSAGAQFDPFDPIFYYPYALPSTGAAHAPDSMMLRWLIPTLAGAGALLVALVLVRLRLYRR